MDVRITHHAWQRMVERGVSESEVLAVLTSPDVSHSDEANRSVVYIKRIRGRRVHVAAVFPGVAADPVLVKTVFV